MRNWKISSRLAAAFGLLVLLMLGVVGLALLQLQSLNANTRQITERNMHSVELINRLSTDMVKARLLELRHVNNASTQYKDGIERDMAKLQEEMNAIKHEYSKFIDSAEEKTTYEKLLEQRAQYVTLMKQLFALSRGDDIAKARDFMNGPSLQLYNASEASLKSLLEINRKSADSAAEHAAQTFRTGIWSMGIAALLALVVAVGAGVWITRSIRGPLARAVGVADRVASGDLTGDIEVRTRDEVGQLFAALQRMQRSLIETVQVVRRNAEGVAAASQQIALGNADLSSRTERQASALEETAASMEELGSTVRLNADNASQANALARDAASVAEQGGEVVGNVVTTMRSINESSQKIADIIGVIDSIAFQTNILALNAAVEAARAGEQGRGFAVVAGEVRALAQRSADAAKEIKTLISESVGRVEQGSQLVDSAGSTMSEVVDSIRKVNHIVADISSASSEQSQGVNEISEAISQMDHTTQQNAALVEESAAASDSLRRQAQELVDAVAVFKLASLYGTPRSAAAVTSHVPKVGTAVPVAAPRAQQAQRDPALLH